MVIINFDVNAFAYVRFNLKNNFYFYSVTLMYLISLSTLAVDETIPHPIDERGLLSHIAVKTTRLFRPVEIVEIRNAVLQRPDISIAPGTVVVIQNQDNNNHRLVFLPASSNELVGNFTSAVIGPEKLWGAEFFDIGTYPYKCTLHPEREYGVVRVITPEG